MNFAELSAQRYSLRKFSDRPVEDALLQQVLEAGRNAPTAHNNQPQRIFVLQSPEATAKADACMGCHFHPPVLLAVDARSSAHHEVLLNLNTEVPEGFGRFDRLVEVVSAHDEADRAEARSRWRHYASRGYAITRHDLVLKGG